MVKPCQKTIAVTVAEIRVADVEETSRSAASNPIQMADANSVVEVARDWATLRLVSGMVMESNV